MVMVRRSTERATYSVAHLRKAFGDARAQTLDPALVDAYVVRRKAPRKADDGTETPGATNGTINRELAALKRALTLAVQRRKILTRPYIRIFHDFRRTAVRNLERAGVPRSVAMQMVGHKTEAIYRRYAIVSDADLRAAADKLAAIERPGSGTGTTTGTVTQIGGR